VITGNSGWFGVLLALVEQPGKPRGGASPFGFDLDVLSPRSRPVRISWPEPTAT